VLINLSFLLLVMQQDISKRLSLPADLRIPEAFLAKQSSSSPIFDGPLTRTNRRQSLSEIGFGRMETYTKLDKLGEVSYLHSLSLFMFFFCFFRWRDPLIARSFSSSCFLRFLLKQNNNFSVRLSLEFRPSQLPCTLKLGDAVFRKE